MSERQETLFGFPIVVDPHLPSGTAVLVTDKQVVAIRVDGKVAKMTIPMWEIGVEGDKFNPHSQNEHCAEAGCVPFTSQEVDKLISSR
jgi:hypothetical protein